ncbi:uncharacterized protein LOC134687263 isoform X2 [Mytilus trossulus]|uniref:uncharacterized protein LOC134687263 isoform X2 n=1 Tax=Mytilus trossulus TaxID=6551 RepID=UPI003005A87D
MTTIPVIDFQLHAVGKEGCVELDNLGSEMCQALEGIGFCYLKNHGISEEIINEAFRSSKDFFSQPVNEKEKFARSHNYNFGWVGLEVEKLNPERPVGDYKEAWNITLEDHSLEWPSEKVPNFKPSMQKLYEMCTDLSKRIFDVISVGLKLDVMNCEDQYVPATPIPGTIVVNIGDLMQRWTADKLKATKHRVLNPSNEQQRRQNRQSMAFFVHPDDKLMIECLDKSNKYEPISSIDYLNSRFKATY